MVGWSRFVFSSGKQRTEEERQREVVQYVCMFIVYLILNYFPNWLENYTEASTIKYSIVSGCLR